MQKEIPIALSAVHQAFAETIYGQTLNNRVRYEKYKPEDVTNAEWRGLLGADVNNLEHGALCSKLGRVFVRQLNELQPGYITPEEGLFVEVAELAHDWPEAITADKSYSDRDENDEAEELAVLKANLREFYDGEHAELVATSIDQVIFNPTERLRAIHNAIERIGYIRTALRANQYVLDGTAPHCEAGFRWLTLDVLSNQAAALIQHARNMLPARNYVMSEQHRISMAFDMIQPATFDHYGEKATARKVMTIEANVAFLGLTSQSSE